MSMSQHNSKTIEYAEEAFEDCNDCCCKSIKKKSEHELFSLGRLEDNYGVGKVIGQGGFGTVYAGIRKKDKVKVAIKHIAKGKATSTEMVNIENFAFNIDFIHSFFS